MVVWSIEACNSLATVGYLGWQTDYLENAEGMVHGVAAAVAVAAVVAAVAVVAAAVAVVAVVAVVVVARVVGELIGTCCIRDEVAGT